MVADIGILRMRGRLSRTLLQKRFDRNEENIN